MNVRCSDKRKDSLNLRVFHADLSQSIIRNTQSSLNPGRVMSNEHATYLCDSLITSIKQRIALGVESAACLLNPAQQRT